MARKWLAKCDSEHGVHCQNRLTPGKGPQWLIDVTDEKVVRASPGAQYAALSYVWGGAQSLSMTKANQTTLRQPGSLKRAARTIRHAMRFCRKEIEVKFLWVDAIYIVQDDEAHMASQIMNMASIYANAYVTLVAAWGRNADAGLRPKNSSHTGTGKVEGDSPAELTVRDAHNGLLQSSPWLRRGWTLQELVFSQRAIFFFEVDVTWECHCRIWHGSVQGQKDFEPCVSRFSPYAQGLQHSFWPDLEEYAQLVIDYCCRSLTYESDTLNAFSGVTNALTRVFEGGFIFGLPQIFFDAALLWQPEKTLTRRGNSEFPS
jgi:hypothetical protein